MTDRGQWVQPVRAVSGDLLSASLGLFAGLGAAGIGGLVADDCN